MRATCRQWILAGLAAVAVAGCDVSTGSSGGGSGWDTDVPDTGIPDTEVGGEDTNDVLDTDVADTALDTDVADTALDTTPDPFCAIMDPYPARLMSGSGLSHRLGEIQFQARDGNVLMAYTYVPTTWDGSGPVLFGIHGAGRDAEGVRDTLAPTAERHGALLIAPEFDAERYVGFASIVGPELSIPYDDGAYIAEHWAPPEDFLHSELEHLFEGLREFMGFDACSYYLTGHSAGGQFTHRTLTFRPDARVARAVAINPGWYTLPGFGDGEDENFFFPYGLQGTPWDDDHVRTLFGRELTVLVGSEDTATPDEDPQVRDTDEANAQGVNRFERAHHYFAYAQERATALETPIVWRFDVVTGAAHSSSDTFPSAAWYLFDAGEAPPCDPSPLADAAGLVVTEVLVDPPSDDTDPTVGDANNDGFRDADDDEFVELLNTGDSPICLTDWVIREARDEVRHRFPIGTELAPGEAVVVFGGGIPTGAFGGAQVQWAFFQGALGLTNGGDVLQVLAPDGSLHTALSWDDCSEAACADAIPCPAPATCVHWTLDASDNQSVVRLDDGSWGLHGAQPESGGEVYSPGTQTSGERY